MRKAYVVWWYTVVAAFLISSLSVLLLIIPVTIPTEGLPLTYTVCGIVFWAGLAIGILLWLILYLKVRKQSGYAVVKKHIHRPGIANIFSNKSAKAWDCIMILSLAGVIAGTIFFPYASFLNSIFICIFLFSFHLHYLYNGKVYAYINMKNRRKVKHEED